MKYLFISVQIDELYVFGHAFEYAMVTYYEKLTKFNDLP